jgi:hypothetical protein
MCIRRICRAGYLSVLALSSCHAEFRGVYVYLLLACYVPSFRLVLADWEKKVRLARGRSTIWSEVMRIDRVSNVVARNNHSDYNGSRFYTRICQLHQITPASKPHMLRVYRKTPKMQHITARQISQRNSTLDVALSKVKYPPFTYHRTIASFVQEGMSRRIRPMMLTTAHQHCPSTQTHLRRISSASYTAHCSDLPGIPLQQRFPIAYAQRRSQASSPYFL